MNYPEFYQWALLFYAVAMLLLLAIGSWWLRALALVWRLAILGGLVILVAFPLMPLSEGFSPLFIHFGFQLVDSGFDLGGQWPLILPMLLALLLYWALLLVVTLLLRLVPEKPKQRSQASRKARSGSGSRTGRNRTQNPY